MFHAHYCTFHLQCIVTVQNTISLWEYTSPSMLHWHRRTDARRPTTDIRCWTCPPSSPAMAFFSFTCLNSMPRNFSLGRSALLFMGTKLCPFARSCVLRRVSWKRDRMHYVNQGSSEKHSSPCELQTIPIDGFLNPQSFCSHRWTSGKIAQRQRLNCPRQS